MAKYLMHPSLKVKLGYSFDSRRPSEDTSAKGFFTWENETQEVVPQNLGASIAFSIKEVRSMHELYESLSIDISIENKFGLFNASGSFQKDRQFEFKETSLIYVATANKTYNPIDKSGILTLSEKGKKAWSDSIANNRVFEFQRIIGTEVITSIIRGSNVSIVYIFNCSSSFFKEKIKAKLSADWAGGSGSINLNQELRKIDSEITFSVEGFQNGVGGSGVEPNIATIIDTEPGNITVLRSTLKAYLENISVVDLEKCPIISFTTTSIAELPEIALVPEGDIFLEMTDLNRQLDFEFEKLADRRNALRQHSSVITKMIAAYNVRDFVENSRNQLGELRMSIDTLLREVNNISNSLLKARNPEQLVYQLAEIPNYNLTDFIKEPLVVSLGWGHDSFARQTSAEHGDFGDLFFPLLHFRFIEVIEKIVIFEGTSFKHLLDKNAIKRVASNNGSLKNEWSANNISYNKYSWGWVHELHGRIQEYFAAHVSWERGKNYVLKIYSGDIISSIEIGNYAEPRVTDTDISYFSPRL